MITHLFYQQETVEPLCALNSWCSVRPALGRDDEVIVLDLGCTLDATFPLDVDCRQVRLERIRTDTPEQRSYTYGLNLIVPTARHPWVVLWRSDYIYHARYAAALRAGMLGPRAGDFVLPYEAFIGAQWATGPWCREHFDRITQGNDAWLLQHAHVCPVYETMDFPHWAIQRDLLVRHGGIDQRLWGYGWQFPHLFRKVRALSDARPVYQFDMIAFHQNHAGSFGLGLLDPAQRREMNDGDRKLREVLGSREAELAYKKERQTPLRPRRCAEDYRLKTSPRQTTATPTLEPAP